MNYLKINPDNSVAVLNFPAGVDPEKAIQKIYKSEPDCSIMKSELDLPPYPMNSWEWDENSKTIYVNHEKIPFDWPGLTADFMAIPPATKARFGILYVQLIQAIIEQDLRYLEILAGNAVTLNDTDKAILKDLFTKYGVSAELAPF